MTESIITLLKEAKEQLTDYQRQQEEFKFEKEKIKIQLEQEKLDIIKKIRTFTLLQNDILIHDALSNLIQMRFREEADLLTRRGSYVETKGNTAVDISGIPESKIYYQIYHDIRPAKYAELYFTYGASYLEVRDKLDEYEISDCLTKGKVKYRKALCDALNQIRSYPNKELNSILSMDMIIALLLYCNYDGIVLIDHNDFQKFYIIDKKAITEVVQEYDMIFDSLNYTFSIKKSTLDNLIIHVDENKEKINQRILKS